jgi:hypothetical protein
MACSPERRLAMRTCPTCHNTFSDETEFCPRDGARLTAAASETEAQLAWGLARRFRIVRRLGAGGMGTVFLAEQVAVGNRPVALKVLNRKLPAHAESLLRFQNEAASTGRIRHPNVVTIYESGPADDGTPYIAMEFPGTATPPFFVNAVLLTADKNPGILSPEPRASPQGRPQKLLEPTLHETRFAIGIDMGAELVR